MIERLVAALFPTSADDGIDWRADAIALWQLQRSEAPGLRTRVLLDLQIVGHALHERARRLGNRAARNPGALSRLLMASGRFVESAVGISVPVDDPRDEARAVEALGHVGVPARKARLEVRGYYRRVRAAVSPVRDVSVAGVMATAVVAIGLLTALGAVSLILAIVVGLGQMEQPFYVTDGIPVEQIRANAPEGAQNAAPPLPGLGLVLVAVVTAFGMAAGRAERNHWRRTGVHRTFRELEPDGAHRFEIALVTVMAISVASLSALLAYGGQAMVLVFAVIIPGTLLILAAGRAVFAPLFNWSLQHVARLDAAAYARPLIERDIALEVAAEGNFYGRSSFSAESPAGNTAASLWAAQTLASMGIDPDARRAALQRRIQRKTATAAFDVLTRRDRMRYAAGGFGVTLAVWFLARCAAWRIYEIDFATFRSAAGLDAIALAVGAGLAAALGWIHRRHLAIA